MLSLGEFIKWTGLTVFELWLHLIALLVFSILLVLKLEYMASLSYWTVFCPLFVASALNCYFHFIVFVRSVCEFRDCKAPIIRYAFNWLRVLMIIIFEAVLCYKIEGDLEHGQVAVKSTYGVVFMPIWILMAALGFQACRMF